MRRNVYDLKNPERLLGSMEFPLKRPTLVYRVPLAPSVRDYMSAGASLTEFGYPVDAGYSCIEFVFITKSEEVSPWKAVQEVHAATDAGLDVLMRIPSFVLHGESISQAATRRRYS